MLSFSSSSSALLLVGSVQPAVAYVLPNGAREQVHFLQYHAEAVAEIRLLYISDVNAVIGYLALLYVVEAVYKVGYGGLARAGSADEGYLLPRLCEKAHIVENYLVRNITKVHVLQSNVAL